MKNSSLLVLVLALGAALPVRAQTEDAPADSTSADSAGPAVAAEGLAEPEPEVSDSESEESGTALGQAAPSNPSVDEDLEDAAREGEPAAVTTPHERDHEVTDEENGEPSTADRLAQAVPTAGVPWSMPLSFSTNFTANTFSKDSQLTYDPYHQLSLLAGFRWRFDSLLVGIQQGVNFETTAHQGSINSSITTYARELQWTDTRLDATYSLPWSPLGVGITTQLALFLPTSKFSRASGRVLGISPLLFLSKGFAVAEGLILQGAYRYTGWTGNVHAVRAPDGYGTTTESVQCPVGEVQDGTQTLRRCNTGANPIRHQSSATLAVTILPVSGLAFSVSYGGLWFRALHAPGADIQTDTGTVHIEESSSTNRRIFHNFSLSVSYDITPYLTAGLSYGTFTSWFDTDSGVRNPFYNVDSTISVNVQFRPDFLATELRANREREAAEETARRHSQLNGTF
ncbi:MAG: hypothetical protein H6722_18630 [Sandaracinus sp.]|nr:hypothetical protein [Sandaracinus sp.]